MGVIGEVAKLGADYAQSSRKPRGLGALVLTHLGERLRQDLVDPGADDLPASLAQALTRLEQALTPSSRSTDHPIRDALLAAMPALRNFAMSLTHDPTRSDDLVQDTLVRAWDKAASFQPGTNLNAWLFTILRNLFYSEQRKRKREVEDADGALAGRLASAPAQEHHVGVAELRSALRHLPPAQREALLLVGAQSFTYEEAAAICGVAVGTIKSRVSRARVFLSGRLGMDGADDLSADAVMRAATPIA